MKTVKVRMLESVSGIGDQANGIEGDFSLPYGAEVEIPAELAQKWVAIGRCTILDTESATAPAASEPTQAKPAKK